MAASAGTVRVKVVPDIDGFTDAVLDAIAERVADKIVEKDMIIRAHVRKAMGPTLSDPRFFLDKNGNALPEAE